MSDERLTLILFIFKYAVFVVLGGGEMVPEVELVLVEVDEEVVVDVVGVPDVELVDDVDVFC